MKKVILLVTTLTLLLFAASLLAEDMMKKMPKMNKEEMIEGMKPNVETAFTGYLSDVLCGEAGMDPDETDLTKTPEKHTKMCMMSEECAASGYGIFTLNEKKMYEFHKFDEKGNEIAINEILPNTEKENALYIIVMGTMEKDGMISVTAIKEAKLPEQAEEVEKEMTKEIKHEMEKN